MRPKRLQALAALALVAAASAAIAWSAARAAAARGQTGAEVAAPAGSRAAAAGPAVQTAPPSAASSAPEAMASEPAAQAVAPNAPLGAAAAAGAAGSPNASPASRPPATLLRLKTSPPEAFAFLDGEPLALAEAGKGYRAARVGGGSHELLLLADGYVASKLPLEAAGSVLSLEAKLERFGPGLRLAALGPTGRRPKSVEYSPDGCLLVVPLLSGRGAEVLDAATLRLVGILAPPEGYARQEGFVESAFFPALDEVWVSQMHTSAIHVFDLATLAYKESFPSGGSYPKVIAASPDGRKAYVTNWVSEDLSVFDAGTRRLLAKVKLGGTPRGLAPSPDGKELYVARFSGGSILRVRLDDLAVETFWPADGGAKRSLALDASRGRLYATDMDRGSLFALDLGTGRLLAEVPLGWNPNGLALSPDGSRVYACTRGPNGAEGYERPGPLAGELVAVDAESLAVVARQWGGNQPTGLAASPDGRRLVFTDFLDRRVEAYDIDSRER